MATEIAVVDGERVDTATGEVLPVRQAQAFDLAQVEHPTRALDVAQRLVSAMAERCKGPSYIKRIGDKDYPLVTWWTTVGAALGLFPREESSTRLELDGVTAYEAVVGVYRGDQLVTRASAVCSRGENRWRTADEYAVRSMAVTRATGKAYRLSLSFLAVMSGLEATPAEEMPGENGNGHTEQASNGPDRPCPKCGGPTWNNVGRKKNPKAPDYKCRDKSCDGVIWPEHDERDEPATEEQLLEVMKLLDAADITDRKRDEIKEALMGDYVHTQAWALRAIAYLKKKMPASESFKAMVDAADETDEAELPFGDDGGDATTERDLAPSALEEGH